MKRTSTQIRKSTKAAVSFALLCAGFLMNSNMPSELSENSPIGTRASAYVEKVAAWLVRSDNQVLHTSLNNFLHRKNMAHRNLPVYYADLADLRARRFLRIITKPDPHNYFLKQGELVGFAYELIRKFARQKKLRVQMLVASSDEEMLEWLEQGKGDIISANLLLEGKQIGRASCRERV